MIYYRFFLPFLESPALVEPGKGGQVCCTADSEGGSSVTYFSSKGSPFSPDLSIFRGIPGPRNPPFPPRHAENAAALLENVGSSQSRDEVISAES